MRHNGDVMQTRRVTTKKSVGDGIAYVRDLPKGVLQRLRDQAVNAGAVGSTRAAAGPVVRWVCVDYVRLLNLCARRRLDPQTLEPVGDGHGSD